MNKFLNLLILKFGIISAVGFMLDVGIFFLLNTGLTVSIMLSNIIASLSAVSFVYGVSTRKLFDTVKYKTFKYFFWTAYQAVLIYTIGRLISWGSLAFHLQPVFLKVLLMPLSFSANFLVMNYLINSDRRVNTQ